MHGVCAVRVSQYAVTSGQRRALGAVGDGGGAAAAEAGGRGRRRLRQRRRRERVLLLRPRQPGVCVGLRGAVLPSGFKPQGSEGPDDKPQEFRLPPRAGSRGTRERVKHQQSGHPANCNNT